MTEYQDPAEVDTTPRRANLTVDLTKTGDQTFVRLDASNGEPLGTGETHNTLELAEESREAWLRAFVEVLEDEGYVVMKPHPESSGEQLLKAIFGEPEEGQQPIYEDLDYNGGTLDKVYNAMLDNGVDTSVAKASVSAMQNAGILFRERRA